MPDLFTAPSGRQYYRHETNLGSVMIWKDHGTEKQTLILDSQYRLKNAVLMNELNPGEPGLCKHTGYINTDLTVDTTPADCASFTDEYLDSKICCSQDTHLSKTNTDLMNNLILGNMSPIASVIRSFTINGVGCDVPNINTLARMYCDGVFIDTLDPTVIDNPDSTLGRWFEKKSGHTALSSSYMTDEGGLHYFLRINLKGKISFIDPVSEKAMGIPTLDLERLNG